jgi:hypothetical protein
MAKQKTNSQILKSVAGFVLAVPGLFVLRSMADEAVTWLSHFRSSTFDEGFGALHFILLAASFNHHRAVQEAVQGCASLWPLLPLLAGAALVWNNFMNGENCRPSC